ncbi:corrinoid protein [Chloroflexota bacterium]
MATYIELQELVITGQRDKVKAVISSLLGRGKAPMEIISDGLVDGMNVVGAKFKSGEMFIPEVIASAHAMREGTDILKPLVVGETSSFDKGKILMVTVEGDIHTIGKNIVSMLLESGGFRAIDLGTDIPANNIVEAVKKEQPKILGMSAMLTTTMPRMKDVIESLKEAGIRDKVRVMIGGAPISRSFADSIGADGYAPDGLLAVDKAKELVS